MMVTSNMVCKLSASAFFSAASSMNQVLVPDIQFFTAGFTLSASTILTKKITPHAFNTQVASIWNLHDEFCWQGYKDDMLIVSDLGGMV